MKDCDKWREHAGDTFDFAYDQLQQSLDVFLSFSERFDLVKDAFGNILLVTPNIISDLLDCGILQDVTLAAKWVNRNDDIGILIQDLIANMLKNWFKMSTMLISIPFNAASQNWKGLGHDIGSLIKDLVELPDDNSQTGAEAAASHH